MFGYDPRNVQNDNYPEECSTTPNKCDLTRSGLAIVHFILETTNFSVQEKKLHF